MKSTQANEAISLPPNRTILGMLACQNTAKFINFQSTAMQKLVKVALSAEDRMQEHRGDTSKRSLRTKQSTKRRQTAEIKKQLYYVRLREE